MAAPRAARFLIAFSVGLLGCQSAHKTAPDLTTAPSERADAPAAATTERPASALAASEEKVDAAAITTPTAGSVGQVAETALPGRQRIQTATCRFGVASVDTSSRVIEQATARAGGYVTTSNLTTADDHLENALTLRVPAANFGALMADIRRQATFVYRQEVQTQEVTAEFVDIEARLRTKREVEARYVDILRGKAKTVAEVLQAEAQIGTLREEIEAQTGRLSYLRDQVRYSTIVLELTQPITRQTAPETAGPAFGPQLREALSGGWELLLGLVLVLARLWVLAPLALVVWLARRRWLAYQRSTHPATS